MKPSDLKEPRFTVALTTSAPVGFKFQQNAFYQSYFQLLNPQTTSMTGVQDWENYICSLRYTTNSAIQVTDIDFFSDGTTCGTTKLSTITTGNYRAVKGEKECKSDPWRNDPQLSSFKGSSYTCAANRDLFYVGATTLYLTGTVTYRTGFNTFDGSTDLERNTWGNSGDLTFTLVEGAE